MPVDFWGEAFMPMKIGLVFVLSITKWYIIVVRSLGHTNCLRSQFDGENHTRRRAKTSEKGREPGIIYHLGLQGCLSVCLTRRTRDPEE